MKLPIYWTTRGYSLRSRLNLTGEALVRRLAHRLPRRLAYWSFIDSGVRLAENSEIAPKTTYLDLLKRAEDWA